ncbi:MULTISPECIES: TetR/AcrR family transcriptional regulator [Streptomyces]|uniref:TetR/AcrR family transcriptional regulator n=1 Tax=Streptomyces prasinus TaxID=67345 RepID=A0ABX6ASA5_9ACTN|nr:TetR/AcrR family transcriptional regulator [Streptomyces prasinus]QEV04632.1 TetR/AcrR family transcriptional regulator [Streptomyces prasinus]
MARSVSAMRGQILESALRLFAVHGFRGTSLQDIASDAGCSKASLLYHFAGKEKILTELLTPARDALATLLDRVSGLEGGRLVEEAVVGYVDLALRFRREIRLLFEDIAEMSCHQDLNVMELADGLLDALAGRSQQAPSRVAAWMVLGAVFITSATDDEVAPDEVLRAEMIRSALRTLDHTPS